MNLGNIKPSGGVTPFIFIGETVALEGLAEPLELFGNVFIKRAEGRVIDIIKMHLQPYIQPSLHNHINPYQTHKIPDSTGGHRYIPVHEEEKWQYWIVEHGNAYIEENLSISLELSETTLTPLFEVFGSEGRSGIFNPFAVANFLNDRFEIGERRITNWHITSLNETRTALEGFTTAEGEEYPTIKKALKDFVELKDLPKRSPFQIVGIFSIIENLLAHNPKRGTPNSINSQLKSKIKLLNNRFSDEIDFHSYFPGPNTVTDEIIIEKLYDYRSSIAHGDFTDFERSLEILSNPSKVREFLHTLLRRIIIQSLKEPQLITDLKRC